MWPRPWASAPNATPKGLYAKALAGELKHFTGISDPYEPPLTPEITLHTEAESVDDSVHHVLRWLEVHCLLEPGP
jgi:adenylylsulfate kinase-like enzyme